MRTLRVIARGRVQGVFFRASILEKASGLGIGGYVRNLENGDVEVLIQGENDQLQDLLGFIKLSPGASHVDSVSVEEIEEGPFTDFEIRR